MDKNIFALSLFGALNLTTSSALAETTGEQTNTCCNTSCCETCCCKPKPKKCIDCECYTPQFYDLQCNCGFFVDGEFLYWFARENNLSYATKIKSDLIFPETEQLEFDVFSFSPKTYNHVGTKWDPGFRVGVGHHSECDGWDYFLSWTHFRNQKSNSISVPPDYELALTQEMTDIVIIKHPYYADNQQHFLLNPWINASFQSQGFGHFSINVNLVSNLSPLISFDKIHAKWHLDFHLIDLEIGRKYWLSKCFNLRPFAALRGAHTETTFRTQSFRNTVGGVLGQIVKLNVQLSDRFKTQNWGVGLLGGIQPTWYFCRNFSLYSSLDIALLWGESKNKKEENYVIDVFNISESESLTTPIPRNQSKSKFYQMNTMLDLAIGLRWEENWCNKRYLTIVDIGWEHHIWFDHSHRTQTTDAVFPIITSAQTNTTKFVNGFRSYNEVTSNLGYGGLVARLRLDF